MSIIIITITTTTIAIIINIYFNAYPNQTEVD